MNKIIIKTNTFFLIFVLKIISRTSSVNISRLKSLPNYNSTSSAIGPPCTQGGQGETCTLANGGFGQCAADCNKPATRHARICCHLKYETALRIYYCCEDASPITVAVGAVRTEEHEFPYMAALGWYTREKLHTYAYKCGGALISKKFVLTAAHCAYYDGIEPVVVLPGGVNLASGFNNYPLTVETVHVHPEYDDDFAYNDIALIELVGEYTGVTIDLWRRNYIANTSFTAIGYGDTTFGGTSSDALLKVFLDYVPIADCQPFYQQQESVPSGIRNTQVCAKDPKNIMDTCQGDSGGPLIMTAYNKNRNLRKEYLFGITSFGQGCALAPPGVYSLVAAFIDWINEHVKKVSNATTLNNDRRNWI